jgi:glycosyltransferase involved in cell wall biosynthesis
MKAVCMLVQNHYDVDIRVRRKAEALVAAGYAVDVLALQSSFSKSKNYRLCGVNVETIALGKKRGSLIRYIFEYVAFFVWAFFKLSTRMSQRQYAVVDVNNLPDFLVFAGAYAKWRGSRIVFDMHEITPEFYISKYGIKEDSLLIGFLKWIEKMSFNFADYVITINEPITQLLISRGLPLAKTTEVLNSVDESLFDKVLSSPNAPKAGEKQPQFVMMYHGTLTRPYGLDLAIEAFGLVQKEMPGAQFWILGNGPEKPALEVLAEKAGLANKTRFIGSVRPEEVPQWLNRCDVGVLATRRDIFLDFSFSNKLSEYIILGKPVISSRLKAIRHYFSEDALSFFEANNPVDLAYQMARLYKEKALRTKLAVKAKQEYMPIRWEVMKQRYLKMMDDVSGHGAVRPPDQCTQFSEPDTAPRWAQAISG